MSYIHISDFYNIIFLAFLHFSLPSLYFFFVLDEACRMKFRSLIYFLLHVFLLTSLLLQKVLERQLDKDFSGKEREIKKWQTDIFIMQKMDKNLNRNLLTSYLM